VLFRSMLTSILLAIALQPAKPAPSAVPGDLPPILYTVAASYEPLAWMHSADRFSAGATIMVRDENRQRPLVPNFAAAADPAVSFDGQRVLFAGKAHPEDHWQIWELILETGRVRPVTSAAADCVRPFFLPEDRLVYARRVQGRFVIERLDLTGKNPLALTYGPANFLPTDVLRDGRILFEAGFPLGSESVPEIYTVYSDGSGVESYRCDHGLARHSGRQVHSGDIIFASSRGLARFTSARAQGVPVNAPGGEYAGDVTETASGDWLLSWRLNAAAQFRLMRWAPSSADLKPAFEPIHANVIQPVLLASRAIVNRHPSGLHDWPNANLLCLNAYTSKYKFAPGSIHSVRIYMRGDGGNSRLLGTAPVERDGSFFVQVPANQPLQIELLDATGKTLQREAGFFWMRRGEQRGCVGCHAGPETSPENAVPMILLKSTTPADLTGASGQTASGGH
jgi:hypothetical protein